MQGISLSGLGYYFDGVASAHTDGLFEPSEVSRYGGVSAARVGIAGREVIQSDLAELLRGGGALEHCGVGAHRVRHAFIDVVFTCPKSVSLLFGLAPPVQRGEVLAAHVTARDTVLSYLERVGAWVKAPTGARTPSRADGFIWAPFVHHVNRSGDPHLHSHVVVANLVQSPERGWSPLYSGALFSERIAAGQLYRAALRFELAERLGLEFRSRSAKGSDVVGFSDSVLDAFSRRDVLDVVQQRKESGRFETAVRHRRRFNSMEKQPVVPLEELHEGWESRAMRLGVVIHRDVVVTGPNSEDAELRASDLANRVDVAVHDSISAFDTAFARSELIAALGSSMAYGAPVAVIESSVDVALKSLETNTNQLLEAGGTGSARYDRRHLDRYVNARVAAMARTEAELSRDALVESDLMELCGDAHSWPGAFTLATLSTEREQLRAYATLRAVRAAAVRCERPLRLVVPTRAARSLFEITTGAEVPKSDSRAGRNRAGLTIVVDAWRLSVASRTRIVEVARERGDLVVLCDVARPRIGPLDRTAGLVSHVVPDAHLPRRYDVGAAVEAVVVDAVDRALVEIRALEDHFGKRARVVIDHRLHFGGFGTRRPDLRAPNNSSRARVAHALGAEGRNDVLVVLGDAYGLRREDLDLPRVHVLVAPPEAQPCDERALAFSLCGWTPGLNRAKAASREVSDRFAWGWKRLVAHDRVDVWQEHELSPERIAISRGELERGDARAEEQRGMRTRPVRDGVGREPTLTP